MAHGSEAAANVPFGGLFVARHALGVVRMRRQDRESMTSEEIKDLLSKARRASMIPTPPGFVAILISNLQVADTDLAEIREWVQAHGGKKRDRKQSGLAA